MGRFCLPNTRKMEPNEPISDMLEDFSHCYASSQGEGSLANRWLRRDEIGISVFPTIYPTSIQQHQPSARDVRMVCNWTPLTIYT